MIPLPFPLQPAAAAASSGPQFEAKTANYQLVAADHGKVLSNAGAETGIAISVDPELPAGFQVTLLVEASQAVTFFGGMTVVPLGDSTASGTQGSFITLLRGDGNWYALAVNNFTTGS